MNEQTFLDTLAPFTAVPADALALTDDLAQIGVDSISIFEFVMQIEDLLGHSVEVTDQVVTAQDLYDAVLQAGTLQLA